MGHPREVAPVSRPRWVAIGYRDADGSFSIISTESAGAAVKVGRNNVERLTWHSFRVARVTSHFVRGAVRVKP